MPPAMDELLPPLPTSLAYQMASHNHHPDHHHHHHHHPHPHHQFINNIPTVGGPAPLHTQNHYPRPPRGFGSLNSHQNILSATNNTHEGHRLRNYGVDHEDDEDDLVRDRVPGDEALMSRNPIYQNAFESQMNYNHSGFNRDDAYLRDPEHDRLLYGLAATTITPGGSRNSLPAHVMPPSSRHPANGDHHATHIQVRTGTTAISTNRGVPIAHQNLTHNISSASSSNNSSNSSFSMNILNGGLGTTSNTGTGNGAEERIRNQSNYLNTSSHSSTTNSNNVSRSPSSSVGLGLGLGRSGSLDYRLSNSFNSSNDVQSTSDTGRLPGSSRLDEMLKVLREEMNGLREMDLSLLSQLNALKDKIIDYKVSMDTDRQQQPNGDDMNGDNGEESDLDDSQASGTGLPPRAFRDGISYYENLPFHLQNTSSPNSVSSRRPPLPPNVTVQSSHIPGHDNFQHHHSHLNGGGLSRDGSSDGNETTESSSTTTF